MNNLNDIIVGLDIGTTKIACFIGQRSSEGKIKIIGFGRTESKGVERGVVKNIKDTSISIKKAVDEATEQAGIAINEVYVGIAGQHIKSTRNLGSYNIKDHDIITNEDVNKLIEDQYGIAVPPGEEIIHVFPQNFIVDDEELSPTVDPVGVVGKVIKSNFHIVRGNTMNLRAIHESVERAGLRIKGVVLEPIASSYAVLDDTDRDAGVALVDIGGGTTDIAIFKDGIIRHTTVLPLAGNAITNDIKENCRIMRGQAEALKTRFGSCLPENVSENDIISIPGLRSQPPREISMRTLAGIIKARTETIIEQVKFEIEESHLEKDIFAGIVLTGGGAQMRHIKEFTEFTTGIDSRIGLPDEHLDKDTNPEIINTMYATGIGLVLYGFDKLDEKRALENDIESEQPEPVKETPKEEPAQTTPNDIFADLPAVETTTPTIDDVETEQPKEPDNKPDTTAKRPRRPGWGSQAMKAIDKYFGRVFGDDNIKNEGKEERDI